MSQNSRASRNSGESGHPIGKEPASSFARGGVPLRFVHAAQLRLDQPWQGVGRIPEELLPIVEQATVTAWEFIQRQCYELQVDFLLLTGNTLVAAEFPLGGEAALIRGLNQLHDLNIPVYLIPGELDPEHYWDTIDDRLPPNTHRLSSHDPAAEIYSNHGEGIATLVPIAGSPATAPESWVDPEWWETWVDQLVDRDAPFPIGLIHEHPHDQDRVYGTPPAQLETLLRGSPLRYIASGATLRRWTAQIGAAMWHVPGSPIAFRSNLSESVGCSLVEVDTSGRLTTRQLPTSPVRREIFSIAVSPVTMRSELIDQLSDQLSKTTIARDQRLCWIDLVIRGGGLLAEELRLPEARRRLRQDVFDFTNTEQVPVWIDRIDFEDTRSNSELIAGSSRLAGDFLQQLEQLREGSSGQEISLLGEIPVPVGIPESAWHATLGEIDLDRVVTHVRSTGARLLAPRREGADEDL